jgi:hypothetical protein
MLQTPVDLYRVGSLGKVRDADVLVYAGAADLEVGVRGLGHISLSGKTSRGVSCYDSFAGASALNGKVRHLQVRSNYDDSLLTLWPDHPGASHWNWSPARDMPGSEFLRALRVVDLLFK